MIHLETLVTPDQRKQAVDNLRSLQCKFRKNYLSDIEYQHLTKLASRYHDMYGTTDPDSLESMLENLHN